MRGAMKLIQVYFLSMTLYRISKGQQHHEEGEVAAQTQIYNQVNADAEDNDAHLRREGSSLKRMCFNVSLQMSAKVMIYKFKQWTVGQLISYFRSPLAQVNTFQCP